MDERFEGGPHRAQAVELAIRRSQIFRRKSSCVASQWGLLGRITILVVSVCAMITQLAGCSSPRESEVTVSAKNAKTLLLAKSEIGRGWSILQAESATKSRQISNVTNCRLGPNQSPVGGVIAKISFISPGALSEVDEVLIGPATPSDAYIRLLDWVRHCERTIDQVSLSSGSRKPISYPFKPAASPGVGTSSIGFEAKLGPMGNARSYFRYYVEVGDSIVELSVLGRETESFAVRTVKLAVNKLAS
jgi:hypothetical protein